MFTGIVEEVGRIAALETRATGSRVRIDCDLILTDIREGDSICVSGVCLTAVDVRPGSFGADLSPETLGRSSFAQFRAGSPVNLERSLTPNARMGGHLVQGHVDGVGKIDTLQLLGDGNYWLGVRIPQELDRYVAPKGSVCIEGISLTVANIENCLLEVAVIPHTFKHTTLASKRPGDSVNLETDVLARYVEKLLNGVPAKKPGLTLERLREEGW